ncbi:MAG: TonB-dependent receptor [Candidatus Cloacimonetes bacterium]|nr:TonB-dependent receptor [Candidatus Cloacimonadota bacterium]
MYYKKFAISLALASFTIPIHSEDFMDFQSLLSGISTNLNSNSTTGATKRLESPLSAPSIVKVYTQKDIEKFDTVYDLLKTAPGVHVENGYFGRQYINIRGVLNGIYNLKILFLVNGIKVNDPVGPHFNLDTIPKESIKRLELIRGAGSVLYGSSAYSGVISIETFDGKGYDKNSANFTLGSAGVFGANANYFEKNDSNQHFFSFRVFGEDGTDRAKPGDYRYHSSVPNGYRNLLLRQPLYRSFPGDASDFRMDYDNHSILGVSEFKDLKFSYGTSKVKRNLSYNEAVNVPFWGGITPIFQNPNGLSVPASFNEDQRRIRSHNNQEQDWIGMEYKKQISDKTSFRLSGKYVHSIEEVREYDLNLFNLDSESKAVEFEIQASHQVNDRWNLIFGYNREEVDFVQKTFSPFVNIASQVFTGIAIPSNEFFNVTPGSLTMDGIYLQSIYQISDKISFLAANRLNNHELLSSGFAPKYALTFELNKDEFFKVIWGKAFRYPSPFELFVNLPTVAFRGNPNLQEEKVTSWEYNWVKSFDNGKKNASVTYYDMELKDLLTTATTNYVNVAGIVKAKGWELEWDQKINDKLGWYTNLTFMDYVDPTAPNGIVGGQIKFKGAFGFDYKWKENLSLYSNSQWLGERTESPASGLPNQPEVLVHDLGVVYKHGESHRIRMDVLNILDEDYRTLNYSVNMPKMMTPPRGRRVQLSYQIQF